MPPEGVEVEGPSFCLTITDPSVETNRKSSVRAAHKVSKEIR